MAHQFRWSVDVEDSFAPTSLMAIPRMLLHLAACCPQYYGARVIDVKDAFLMPLPSLGFSRCRSRPRKCSQNQN